MRARENELLTPLLEYLADKQSVRLLGPRDASARAPTLALVTRERGEDVAANLAARGIMCGGGNFYGVRCLEAQGVNPDHGALRVSFVHYTAEEEVARLMGALEGVV